MCVWSVIFMNIECSISVSTLPSHTESTHWSIYV